LGVHSLKETLFAYNPWWKEKSFTLDMPDFERDAFPQALKHVEAEHGLALLINGPRRVGKTTMIYQLIRFLIGKKGIPTNRILFFSLDDPIIQQLQPKDQGALFEALLSQWASVAGTALRSSPFPLFCFLDEIQRLPKWELFLKRYIDLRYPIRFIISGSASHTIFRKSLESLLGRLVEISLPPFTFREFTRFHHPEYKDFIQNITQKTLDIGDVSTISSFIKSLEEEISSRKINISAWDSFADEYAQAGGFPQLWDIKDASERTSFVDQQFVQRVTLEDLRLIKEIRRPEIFHQFLRYAFARTGEEYNLEELSALIHTSRVTLASALPLLLQTELIKKVERYSGKPVRLRSTHAKLYAADPILTQSITKLSTSLNSENKGRVAETLAHNIIRRFPGISDISYYREPRGTEEIDFIVRIGTRIVPIEVNYQSSIDGRHLNVMKNFLINYSKQSNFGLLITRDIFNNSLPVFNVPLSLFLLMA